MTWWLTPSCSICFMPLQSEQWGLLSREFGTFRAFTAFLTLSAHIPVRLIHALSQGGTAPSGGAAGSKLHNGITILNCSWHCMAQVKEWGELIRDKKIWGIPASWPIMLDVLMSIEYHFDCDETLHAYIGTHVVMYFHASAWVLLHVRTCKGRS